MSYKSALNNSLFPYMELVLFILERVVPNQSRLLVLTIALLLGVAALLQLISSGSDSNSPSTATSLTEKVEPLVNNSTLSSIPESTLTNTPTSSPVATTVTTAAPQTLSVTSTEEGSMTISGYGNNVIDVGENWPNFRTAIYRSEKSNSDLLIELRDDQVTVTSFGYSDSRWPVQGIRWLDDATQGVKEIAVSASAGWEINLMPDAFLWTQQIDAGNTPQPEDFLLFSSQGLTFVGSQQNPSAKGIGDLMVYNACEGPCKEGNTNWVFQLDPDCSSVPAVFVREVGNPFFERISLSNSGLGEQPLEVALRPYEWLQVLTHCQWSATPTTD